MNVVITSTEVGEITIRECESDRNVLCVEMGKGGNWLSLYMTVDKIDDLYSRLGAYLTDRSLRRHNPDKLRDVVEILTDDEVVQRAGF